MRLICFVLLFCSPLFAETHPASCEDEQKVAIVIGNSNYEKLSKPKEATINAVRMADALTDLGFRTPKMNDGRYECGSVVAPLLDLTYSKMTESIDQFAKNIPKGALVFVYFTGHGVQQGNDNALLAVNAEIGSDKRAYTGALLLGEVLDRLKKVDASVFIAIIDACRETESALNTMTQPSNMPKNSIIAFSVGVDELEVDPSPYTPALLRHIKEPGLRLQELFGRVRQDVTGTHPVEFASLANSEVYLRPLPDWQLVTISGQDERARPVYWPFGWRDITWPSPVEGWLAGTIQEGGLRGDVGRGAVLHTSNGGHSWELISPDRLNAGSGTFFFGTSNQRCDPGQPGCYTWQDVGPLYAITSYPRDLGGGKRRIELWLAGTTGVYRSDDDGQSWFRSTPTPDYTKRPDVYTHFTNFFSIRGFTDVYAVGWPGVAHWSSSDNNWELQYPTYAYYIGSITANAAPSGLGNWDIWAVGVDPSARGSIYHLDARSNHWQPVQLNVYLDQGQGLTDILFVDTHGFAVGQNGVILRASRRADGMWAWTRLESPTNQGLNSIGFSDGMLWVVGDGGVVLKSRDFGNTWKMSVLTDEEGRPAVLKRVKFFENGGWILGNGVVFKTRKSPTSAAASSGGQ